MRVNFLKWIQYLRNAKKHFQTVQHHRKLVREGCFRAGMYWQGLTHDLSKYTIPEFKIGIQYYLDGQSPHNGERQKYGYSTAWLHHKGRNKHHPEYWMDYEYFGDRHVTGMRMPTKYVVEMFVDRVSASKNYRGKSYQDSDALAYYQKRKDVMVIHKDSREILERLLHMLAEEGEDATYAYIRKKLLRNDFWLRQKRKIKEMWKGTKKFF